MSLYRVFLLPCHRALQLKRVESLHALGYQEPTADAEDGDKRNVLCNWWLCLDM